MINQEVLYKKWVRKMKSEREIRDYIKFMEQKVKGIAFEDNLSDPYDRGFYYALQWVLGECP